MNESILISIKHLLGIEPQYDHFDQDLIIHINSIFFHLKQIGVTDKSFNITGPDERWSDYLSNIDELALIKQFIYLKSRKLFDPPTSGILMNALNEEIKETEWRIYSEVDFGKENN